jgi:hypothetical protein
LLPARNGLEEWENGRMGENMKYGTGMKRIDFFKLLIRACLFVLLALIILALGNKVVTGKDCSRCPVNGTCNGKTDCGKY